MDIPSKNLTDTLEMKLRSVSDTTTQTELDALWREISWISQDTLRNLQGIVEKVDGLKKETKEKLQLLIIEYGQTKKSSDTFSGTLETGEVFQGMRSDVMKSAPEIINSFVKEQLKTYKLTDVQEKIVSLAMTEKLFRKWSDGKSPAEKLIQKLSGGMQSIASIADIFGDSDKKTPSTDAEKQEVLLGDISNILKSEISPITTLLDANPRPAGWDELFQNPHLLAEYTGGALPKEMKPMTPSETVDYLKWLHAEATAFDSRILDLMKQKETMFDTVASLSLSNQDRLLEVLKWFLEIPLIGDFFASFFSIQKGKEEEWMNNLRGDLRMRQSIIGLRSFGASIGENNNKTSSRANPGIDLLKDMDLSGVSHKKLDGFFKYCRESGIEYTEKSIWLHVFGTDAQSRTMTLPKKEDGTDGGTVVFPEMTSNDLEKDFEGFYGKLNALKKEKKVEQKQWDAPSESVSEKGDKPVAASVMAIPGAIKKTEKKEDDKPQSREGWLVSALKAADKIPFNFTYTEKGKQISEEVDFKDGTLVIGRSRFKLERKEPYNMKITSVTIHNEEVVLWIIGLTSEVPKQKIVDWIGLILALKNGENKEISNGNKGTLIVTRVA